MKFLIFKENFTDEKRVPITPQIARKLVDQNHVVAIQSGSGEDSYYLDEDYRAVGCQVFNSVNDVGNDFDVLLKLHPPIEDEGQEEISKVKKGGMVLGFLQPLSHPYMVKRFCEQELTTIALDFMPRTPENQDVDVISGQTMLSGYKAMMDAASSFGRSLGPIQTDAFRAPPTRVFVVGAGGAGLKAIETAKALGAEVTAIDVRDRTKAQVEDLGAYFIDVSVPDEDDGETTTGYAKEMSEAYNAAQAAEIKKALKTHDIVICTALIPYVGAPTLITDDMIKLLKPGSIIVDLAADYGGNVEVSRSGVVLERYGVKIIGYKNYPSRMATQASDMLANNFYALVEKFFDLNSGSCQFNQRDENLKPTFITYQGEIIHGRVKNETEENLKRMEALSGETLYAGVD